MDLRTTYHAPHTWSAVDDDSYDGGPVGWGPNPEAALFDLLANVLELDTPEIDAALREHQRRERDSRGY